MVFFFISSHSLADVNGNGMKARKIIQASRHKSRYRNLAGCAAVLIGFYEPVLWLLNLAFGIWPRCGTKIAEAGKTTKITGHSTFFFFLFAVKDNGKNNNGWNTANRQTVGRTVNGKWKCQAKWKIQPGWQENAKRARNSNEKHKLIGTIVYPVYPMCA